VCAILEEGLTMAAPGRVAVPVFGPRAL